MPADDGLWLHDDEHVCPICPDTSQCRPKQPVNPIQLWARTLALKHRYLLPEGEDLDSGVTPRAKENSEGGQKTRMNSNTNSTLSHPWHNLLMTRTHGLLATHSGRFSYHR